MDTTGRQLVALDCFPRRSTKIAFLYKLSRWEFVELLRPWDIREALKVSLEKIDDEFPGVLAKAAELDHEEWQNNRRRTRRYLADRRDLIYPSSQHLQAQIERIRGFYVPTNVPWRDVPAILRLACKAAGINYGGLSAIKYGIIEPARALQNSRWLGTPDTATEQRPS